MEMRTAYHKKLREIQDDILINRDADTARKIALKDDTIDNLYDQIFRELLTFMAEDPRTITRATRLMWTVLPGLFH
jgi:phosphate uptake regulator